MLVESFSCCFTDRYYILDCFVIYEVLYLPHGSEAYASGLLLPTVEGGALSAKTLAPCVLLAARLFDGE